MAEFSWRDLSRVSWRHTFALAFARSISSGVVLTILMLVTGYRPMPDTTGGGELLFFFFMWSAAAFIAVPAMQLMTRGIGAVMRRFGVLGWAFDLAIWVMQVLPGIAIASGDPIVFIINRMAPSLFDVKDFSFFNLKALIFVLNEEPRARGPAEAEPDLFVPASDTSARTARASEPDPFFDVLSDGRSAPELAVPAVAATSRLAETRLPRRVVAEGCLACPYCAEEIRFEAIKCRFCGEPITDADRKGYPSFLLEFARHSSFESLVKDYKQRLFGSVPATVLDVPDIIREIRRTSDEQLAEQWEIDRKVRAAILDTVLPDQSPLWDVRIYSARFIELVGDFYNPHLSAPPTASEITTHYVGEFRKLREQVDADVQFLPEHFREWFSDLIGLTIEGCEQRASAIAPPVAQPASRNNPPTARSAPKRSGGSAAPIIGLLVLLILGGGAAFVLVTQPSMIPGLLEKPTSDDPLPAREIVERTPALVTADTRPADEPAPETLPIESDSAPVAATDAANHEVEPFMPPSAVQVLGVTVRIRKSPDTTTGDNIIMEADTGWPLDVIGRTRRADGVWYQVRMPDGVLAFVRSDLTSLPAETPGPDAPGQ